MCSCWSEWFLLGTFPSLFLNVDSRPLTSEHCRSFNVVLLSHRCTRRIKRKIRFPWHRTDRYHLQSQQHSSIVTCSISRNTCGSSSDPIQRNIAVGPRKNGGGRREDPCRATSIARACVCSSSSGPRCTAARTGALLRSSSAAAL